MKNYVRTVAATAIAVLSITTVARADLKIVAEVTVKGTPKAAQVSEKPTIRTTYFKPGKQRVETDKGVTISDLEGDKFYTLDPVKKTFYVTSSKDQEKSLADNPMLAMMKTNASTTVTPTAETKTIAGKTAKKVTYLTVMKMEMEGLDPSMAAMLPTFTISGEEWRTEEIALPADYYRFVKNNLLRVLPPMIAKGIQDMVDKTSEIKGLPLSSIMTITVIPSKTTPPQVLASLPKEPVVTMIEVQSVVEGSLDDALFTVPADYTEVKAPPSTLPGFPSGGGGATGQ